MAFSGAFNDDLYRVVLSLSGWNAAVNSVLIERSANEVLWSTVRGGTALPVASGSGSLDDYEYFAAADGSIDTFYRATTVDPAPGMLLDGTGDYASTPDDASLDITGDIDLRCDASLDDWSSTAQTLIAKYDTGTNNRSYQLFVNITGTLSLVWSTDGSAFINAESTVAVPAEGGGQLTVRATLDVDDGSGGYVVTFYTADAIGGPWTQLGDPVDNSGGGTTSIFAGAADLNVGARDDGGGTNLASGIIHAAEVRDGIDGTVVADPDFTGEPSGTTSFADDAGRTWTLNGDAEIVSFETTSIAVTQSDYVAKSIRYPLLNRSVKLGDYGDLESAAQTGVFGITGRSFPIGTTDVNMADRFPIEFVTDTAEEALRLKLLLRLGDIIYLQSPGEVNPRRPPRSMYVVPDSSAVARIGIGTHRRHVVPVQEVAAPSPKVVGTTMTHQNIWNEYASLEALWVAYPDLRTLWADVGSGEDLVVL